MKNILIFLISIFICIGCTTPTINGVVTEIDSYGSVHTSFTIEEMLDKGFDYSDIIKVEFEKSGTYHMPITTAYTEVGIGKPSYCHYAKKYPASFGYCQGDFHKMCGGNIGEKVKITQEVEHGYEKEYEMIQSVYYFERDKYDSDSIFANFRMIQTTNILPNILYRSGNPLNYKENSVRYIYVDSLARKVGINTEIDLADTYENALNYIMSMNPKSEYCSNLFINGKTKCIGMGSDTFCEKAYQGIAEGMRFIIANEPPYLIHCNEGKDRCGFYCMLLEALAGASIEELQYDYMTTFCNLYYFERNTEKYNFNLNLTGNRLIYLMQYPEDIADPNFDWDNAVYNLNKINPYKASYYYLHEKCKLSDDEIQMLKIRICKK